MTFSLAFYSLILTAEKLGWIDIFKRLIKLQIYSNLMIEVNEGNAIKNCIFHKTDSHTFQIKVKIKMSENDRGIYKYTEWREDEEERESW